MAEDSPKYCKDIWLPSRESLHQEIISPNVALRIWSNSELNRHWKKFSIGWSQRDQTNLGKVAESIISSNERAIYCLNTRTRILYLFLPSISTRSDLREERPEISSIWLLYKSKKIRRRRLETCCICVMRLCWKFNKRSCCSPSSIGQTVRFRLINNYKY